MSYSPSYNPRSNNDLLGVEITADELNAAEEGQSNQTNRLLPKTIPTSLGSNGSSNGNGGNSESIWSQSA